MRIVYIAAGAGDMYCGACARDVALVKGLISRGHDVLVMPLYTPLRIDDTDGLPLTPVFYGGVNVYLDSLSRVFRHTPRFIRNALDSPVLLKRVAKWAINTHPQDLGPMTVSVLAGRDGSQSVELEKLIEYLLREARPDVVDITNSLLSGIAPELKIRLKVPVLCSLQGEDSFIEAIPEPFGSKARELMKKNADSIDLFLSPGESYATKMAGFIGVPRDRIRVVRAGIDAAAFSPAAERVREPFTIGYLSVINPTKGLDLLVDAFGLLASEQGRQVRLRVAGKVLRPDYWEAITRKIEANGLSSGFEYLGEVGFADKIEFLRGCGAFCVPSRIGESRGMAVMEAMASGVPVAVPNTGIFPEMIEITGGGLLFESGDANSLAKALRRLMDNPAEADAMGRAGAEAIATHFSADVMTDGVIAVHEEALGRR